MARNRVSTDTSVLRTLMGASRWLQDPAGLAVILVVFLVSPASATSPSDLCETAAWRAARATGVPVSVLKAISLAETGRGRGDAFLPWPWTVNMEGKGVWFDEPDSALSYIRKSLGRGSRSFDVGCFQLNYRWHGENFASLEHMLEPDANALYAARFLKSLYRETGNWTDAAGAYHSRTPKFSERYKARFSRIRDGLLEKKASVPRGADQPAQTVRNGLPPRYEPIDLASRVNRYPLLQQGGGMRGMGSLVPLAATRSPALLQSGAAGG